MVIRTFGEPPYANAANVLDWLLRAERELKRIIQAQKHDRLSDIIEAHSLLRETIESLSKAVQPKRKS
jgi:hypothetical protein